MKTSRSKFINIMILSLIFILCVIYIFVSVSEKNSVNKVYVYDIKEIESEIDGTIEEQNSSEKDEEIIDVLVYDNMTIEQLSEKLNRSLNNELAGYGNFIANYTTQKGIDPYLATAIMLHETGCTWNCSSLVKECNNVGGMKGSGCGAYGYFSTLDEGITRFVDNIYNNYYLYGLTTADSMGSKYAEDPLWSSKVNSHIEKIKNR